MLLACSYLHFRDSQAMINCEKVELLITGEIVTRIAIQTRKSIIHMAGIKIKVSAAAHAKFKISSVFLIFYTKKKSFDF